MKKIFFLLLVTVLMASFASCKKDDDTEETPNTSVGGDQSPMGSVGTTVNSSSVAISGVSNFTATVTNLTGGVSTYSGSAVVTNAAIKNMLSNIPQITIKGDTVSTTSMQFKSTTEGIQSISGLRPGVLVNYSSPAGTTFPISSSSDVRTVVSKSTTDDYSYGFFLIKVSQVEEPVSGLLKSTTGVNKITYWANHKFGLVGVRFGFSDGTSATFPLYTSTENP